jgi:hypothetical protein
VLRVRLAFVQQQLGAWYTKQHAVSPPSAAARPQALWWDVPARNAVLDASPCSTRTPFH